MNHFFFVMLCGHVASERPNPCGLLNGGSLRDQTFQPLLLFIDHYANLNTATGMTHVKSRVIYIFEKRTVFFLFIREININLIEPCEPYMKQHG